MAGPTLSHDFGESLGYLITDPGRLRARDVLARDHYVGPAPVPFLQSIRRVVRACHERWDGKGYPDGLAGEEIPLHARIIFVCDAFDAMTSDRPYRTALPAEVAIRRLRRGSGTQFDPAVVAAFVADSHRTRSKPPMGGVEQMTSAAAGDGRIDSL